MLRIHFGVFLIVLLVANECMIPLQLIFVILKVFPQLHLQLMQIFLSSKLFEDGDDCVVILFDESSEEKFIVIWDF